MPSPERREREDEPSSQAATAGPPAVTHDPLTTLVLLQDLDQMIREASDPKQAEAVNQMGFPTGGVEGLKAAREEMTSRLDRRTLRLYEAAARRYGGRAVVPVRNRTCLGCSALLPTGRATNPAQVATCQSCGRILYPV